MKNVAISEFKAHALRILDEVARTGEEIVVTKRGNPVARVVPYCNVAPNEPGKLADALVFEEDIVSPLGEELWEAAR
ncbi:MAG: type II toxin-antitoxin system prevent-host-death family antitoxin [Candidatus Latescibacteria bacterium]|nr:type II toxin-antitoxin system prevent-host-death family antitoxin [Candidatus Latescibacterota bacterium]